MKEKTIIQGQEQFVDEITFLVNGQINVGYNYEYYLFSKGMGNDMAKAKIAKKLKRTKSGDELGSAVSRKKFRFPVQLNPG